MGRCDTERKVRPGRRRSVRGAVMLAALAAAIGGVLALGAGLATSSIVVPRGGESAPTTVAARVDAVLGAVVPALRDDHLPRTSRPAQLAVVAALIAAAVIFTARRGAGATATRSRSHLVASRTPRGPPLPLRS